MVNSSVSVASELVETFGLSMATRAPLCSVVRSKTIDGRTYQTCLFNSNKHLEHRTSQQYVIYSSSQEHSSRLLYVHACTTILQVLALVAPFMAGCLTGGKRTLAGVRDKRNIDDVDLAAVPTTIGQSHLVHSWRVDYVDPLSAVLCACGATVEMWTKV